MMQRAMQGSASRQIVRIDEEKCDGCGLCVPNCEEGALQIVDGKARLVADRLCDGLGACLGHCPRGAITIETRLAEAFDEAAVAAGTPRGVAASNQGPSRSTGACPSGAGGSAEVKTGGGCPGSRAMAFSRSEDAESGPSAAAPADTPASQLTHWPVQLKLISPQAPYLKGTPLLVTADCVPVAFGGFQKELLRDHAVVMACPKLDDGTGYVGKLADIIRHNQPPRISIAHMEVPCCTGIVRMVQQAIASAGVPVDVEDVMISIQGKVRSRQPMSVGG